jgi:hypothetical protein
MSAAKHLLGMGLKDIIEQACIVDIPVNDPTRADIVGLRRVIGSYRIAIVVQYFDPMLQERWTDDRANGQRDPHDGVWLPPRDITGSHERIRGSILVQANLAETGEEAEKADEIIQEVVSRVKWAIRRNLPKLRVSDGYGESVYDFGIVESAEYDSGGENSHNTREYIRWVAFSKVKEK